MADLPISGLPAYTTPIETDLLPIVDVTLGTTKKITITNTRATVAPPMSLTVKGMGEEATAAEIVAGTQTGGTGAELVVNPKYLKDAGFKAEINMVEVVPPANHTLTNNNAWEDWDLSSLIPANARYVDVIMMPSTTNDIGARKNGSTVERKFSRPGNAIFLGPIFVRVELDANRIIELYGETGGSPAYFTVTGYWI